MLKTQPAVVTMENAAKLICFSPTSGSHVQTVLSVVQELCAPLLSHEGAAAPIQPLLAQLEAGLSRLVRHFHSFGLTWWHLYVQRSRSHPGTDEGDVAAIQSSADEAQFWADMGTTNQVRPVSRARLASSSLLFLTALFASSHGVAHHAG